MNGVERKLNLETVLFTHAETCIKGGYINDRSQGSGSAVEAHFHRPQPDRNVLVVRLVGFHGTHRAEAGITAALREDYRGDRDKDKGVN